MREITLAEFTAILQKVVSQVKSERPVTGAIFQLMYDTGLRVNEVIQVELWDEIDVDNFEVYLSKGEGTRYIPKSLVPELIMSNYTTRTDFKYETYSSVNNTFKRLAPGFLVNQDRRRTTSHAFRYRYMQQLASEGFTIEQIAAVMGHVNKANTAKYVGSKVYTGGG